MGRNKFLVIVLSIILIFSFLIPACQESATPTPTAAPTIAPTKPAATVTMPAPAATATPASQVKKGGNLNVMFSTDGTESHFDANMATLSSYALFWNPVYEPLLTHDRKDFSIIGNLAEKYEVSADGKKITLHIRKGVKWQNVPPVNGREFTSADVKWNLERIKATPTAGQARNLANLDTVETPDAYTVILNMKTPFAPMIYYLADPNMMMYPKELQETYGDKQAKVAIGTGPFLFDAYEPKVSLSFKRNPDYWQKDLPRLDTLKIVFIADAAARQAALRTGQVDMMFGMAQADADTLKKSAPNLVYTEHFGQMYHLRLNAKTKPFDDPRVRKAIHLAIDRQSLIKLALFGAGDLVAFFRPDTIPTGVYIPPTQLATLPGFRPDKTADIAEAKKLLAEAGYANGLTFEASTTACPMYTRANETIKQQLEAIGVTMNIKQEEYTVLAEKLTKTGDYQAMLTNIGGGDADALYFTYYSKSPTNPVGWGNAVTDKLFDEGRAEFDPAKRAAIYRNLEQELLKELWSIPLFTENQYMVAQPGFKELTPIKGASQIFFGLMYLYAWIDK